MDTGDSLQASFHSVEVLVGTIASQHTHKFRTLHGKDRTTGRTIGGDRIARIATREVVLEGKNAR